MIKKFVLFIAMLLPLMAVAQNVTDSWRVHPFYVGAKLQNVIDTGDAVYYLTGNNLYCYDKSTQENESLNSSNYLNDVTVTGIYFDEVRKNLFVAYNNGNIDIIRSGGKVANMSDIKISKVTGSKGIQHISFDDRYAYVATDFGYVVIDESKLVVKESRIYGTALSSVAHVGGWMVIFANGQIFTASDKSYNESIAQYKASEIWRTNARFTPVDNSHFLMASNSGLDLCTIAEDGAVTYTKLEMELATQVVKTKGGFVSCHPNSNFYVTVDATGNAPERHEVMKGELVAGATSGDGALWGLNANGLHKVGDDVNYFKPNAIGIETDAFWTAFNPGENKLYLASTTDNVVLTSANIGAKTEIWTYNGNTWADETPENVPLYNGGADTYQGNYNLLFVPGSKCEYLFSTRAAGICHVIDGKIVNVYYFDNMPRDDKYKASIELDSKGNLFAVQSYKTKSHPVMILPKEKLANPAQVTAESWITPVVEGLEVAAFKRSSFVIARKSDIKIYSSGKDEAPIVVWDDKGNIKNLNPKVASFPVLYDQDGAEFKWNHVRCMASDLDGTIWMGTNIGLITFNPTEAFSPSFRGKRIAVPRNDGTNLADYLLDGIQINCITVDGGGRKWIGTDSEGLFLVSADGTSVLKSFNTGNSPLVSDCIYSVCCNTTNNSVYVVTSQGVMEYFTDVVPPSEDYSTLHVYPNPVRPENGSLVTIAGLMENSLVKITDSAGNVIKQFKSEGGICTWDCCNDAGDRISTGVYYVVASQNEGGSGSSAVTKFVVIK